MTPHAHEPLDDEAIEDALRQALSVEPSPVFRAHVRARLLEEPMPRAGGVIRLVAPLLVAAGVLLVLVPGAIWEDGRSAIDPVGGPQVAPDDPQAVPTSAAPAREAATALERDAGSGAPAARPLTSPLRSVPVRAAPAHTARAVAVTAAPASSAQFDPGEREAFARFVRLSAARRIPLPASLPAADPELDIAVAPIEIPDLEIAPALVESGEGDEHP